LDTDSKPSSKPGALRHEKHSRLLAVGGWLVVVAALTWILVATRDMLDKSHIALAYLLVVLIGTSHLGRRDGMVLALLCFFAFNFFLLPPYHTLGVTDSRDWLVLLAFLLTSLVAAQLLYRAQNQAAIATSRTQEIDRLSTLGAETLSAGRAEEAVRAIAGVIQSHLGLVSCEIFLADEAASTFPLIGFAMAQETVPSADAPTSRVFDYVVQKSAVAVERIDATIHVLSYDPQAASDATWTQRDARVVVIPLQVRQRCVGIMRLAGEPRVYLDPEQRRFAQALSYYAALSVERVRLMAEAEHSAALRAADELKDSFVAAVSHDLRTPLTTIKALAHELSVADERAAIIESEADRLNRFVGDVLDLSRLNAGEVNLHFELNTAEDLVGAALAQISGLERGKDVQVIIPQGDVIIANFDFVHSLRCLVNLLENALKYSPVDTQVELIVESAETSITFSVMDRGPGVAAAHVPRIFEPFVRIERQKTSGAGLGLAIAYRLAKAQSGSITYQPRLGGGSVFSLVLPATTAPHPPIS
jgi:two-component system sensor histidine kinase KdpD